MRFFALFAFLLLGVPAIAEPVISAEDIWVRTAINNQRTRAVYMVLKNDGNEDIVFVGATSPFAERAKLQENKMLKNGSISLIDLDEVVVPAGSALAFEKGGHHIMLIGLKRELLVGFEVPITLITDSGNEYTFRAEVRSNSHCEGK